MAVMFKGVSGAFLALALAASSAVAADRAIIVLDASGSMWAQVDGRPKQEIAREALRTVLPALPADSEVGLVAYGHRDKGSCTDIELLVPPAAGTAAAIAGAADALKFVGKTPLSAAVRKAAEALDYTSSKASVVVLTDGADSCQADPCALGRDLERSGADITVNVVGFGLPAGQGGQVACLAEATGGRYFEARDASQLSAALEQAMTMPPAPVPSGDRDPVPGDEEVQAGTAAAAEAEPEFNLMPTLRLSQDGPALDPRSGQSWVIRRVEADGSRGEYVSTEYGDWKGRLEPGDYAVIAQLGRVEAEQRIRIEPGKVAEPAMVLNAGTLKVRPLAASGQQPDVHASVRIDYPGGQTTEYGETAIVLPAGELKVTVAIGKGEVSQVLTLAPGQTIEKDMVVGVGRAVIAAYLVEGQGVDDAALFVQIFSAAPGDGQRQEVSYEYGSGRGHALPPGDYTAVATVGGASAEAPFSVRAGEQTDVRIVLGAGELVASAPGRSRVAVYGAARDASGSRKEIVYEFGDKLRTTLPAGDYVVVGLTADTASKEVPVTIRAGSRTEIAVP